MRVVLCHGVFDLLHIGHVRHLHEAKTFGEYLVVSVVADRYIHKNKHLTVYDEGSRIELLNSIRYVDRVMLCEAPGPEAIIEQLRPTIYVRGVDYIGKRTPEEDLLEKLGIQIGYTKSVYERRTSIIKRIVNSYQEGSV